MKTHHIFLGSLSKRIPLLGAALFFGSLCQLGAFQNPFEALKAAREKARASDFAGAEQAIDEAIRLSGTNAAQRSDALLYRAEVREIQKEYDKALEILQAIYTAAETPVNQRIRSVEKIAAVLRSQGNNDLAVERFRDALANPAFSEAAHKERILFSLAQFYEGILKPDDALGVFEEILKLPGCSDASRVRALRARARILTSLYRFEPARKELEAALQVASVKTAEQASILNDLADSLITAGEREEAKRVLSKILETPGLNEAEKKGVVARAIKSYRRCNDFEGARKALSLLGDLNGKGYYPMLLDYVRLAEANKRNAEAKEAWGMILSLPDLTPQQLETAAFARINLLADELNRKEIGELALRVANDPGVKGPSKLAASIIAAGVAGGKPAKITTLPKADLDGEQTANAYASAAKVFMRMGDYENARFLNAQAEALYEKRPELFYDCQFVEQAPVGVSGWLTSPLVREASRRESRFEPYNKAAAALLVNDVNVVRNVETSNAGEATSNLGFYMLADSRGWHIYADIKDDQAEQVEAGLVGGGAMEMYIVPGEGEAYYQFLIDVPSGKTTCIPWNSPHRFYRKLDSYLKTQVAPVPGGFGAYLFVPWEVVYDKLPKEGDAWPFGFIYFGRQGGFTWGSGQVHELHRFGKVRFVGIEKAMPAIRRAIVMKAFAKYKEKARTVRRIWKDEIKGDPGFFQNVLDPELAKLDEYGKLVTPEMSQQDVDRLFAEAVPNWMELDYHVAELRTRYLTDKVFSLMR